MSKTLLDLETLLKATGGKLIGIGAGSSSVSDFSFTSVTTDSRNVVPGSLFVPLIGENQNGHKYIPQAIEKGASVVFVNSNENTEGFSSFASVVFIAVDNTLYALQAAAKAYAQKVASNMIRVSITGSSGKTTTKEMLVSVCKAYFGEDAVACTKGNFNSETGLPLSMFQIRGDEKIGIFEMGMNRENEIGEISAVWQSQYGLITNIGNAHIGILGSRQNIANEKRKSFDYIPQSGAAFVPEDDDFADYCTQNVKGKIVRFGKSVPQEISGVEFICDKGLLGTQFKIDGIETWLRLPGEYNFQNALGVIALAKTLGIPADAIKQGLESVAAMSGRMEIKSETLKNDHTATIVCDCYNANPDSMKKAIELFAQVKVKGQKVLVLGDMKELGKESEAAHKEIGELVVGAGAYLVILIGPEMEAADKVMAEHVDDKGFNAIFMSSKDNADDKFEYFAKQILSFTDDDSLILIKGSHSMSLEKIIPLIVKEKEADVK